MQRSEMRGLPAPIIPVREPPQTLALALARMQRCAIREFRAPIIPVREPPPNPSRSP